jgi:hypothetical protein
VEQFSQIPKPFEGFSLFSTTYHAKPSIGENGVLQGAITMATPQYSEQGGWLEEMRRNDPYQFGLLAEMLIAWEQQRQRNPVIRIRRYIATQVYWFLYRLGMVE